MTCRPPPAPPVPCAPAEARARRRASRFGRWRSWEKAERQRRRRLARQWGGEVLRNHLYERCNRRLLRLDLDWNAERAGGVAGDRTNRSAAHGAGTIGADCIDEMTHGGCGREGDEVDGA